MFPHLDTGYDPKSGTKLATRKAASPIDSKIDTKKRKTRRILVYRRKHSMDFEIDEDDYLVVYSIMPKKSRDSWIVQDAVEIDANDITRRVRTLRIDRWVKAYTDIHHIPDNFGQLTALESFHLNDFRMESVPIPVFQAQLSNLKKLDLSRTSRLKSLPDKIRELKSLEILQLRKSGIMCLPDAVGFLTDLKELDLSCSKRLSSLPDSIGNLVHLQIIWLQRTHIKYLPNSIGNLANLKILQLQSSEIKSLPDSIGGLQSLMYLNISMTKIPEIWMKKKRRREYTLGMAHRLRSLGWIFACGSSKTSRRRQLRLALGRNRARYRMPLSSEIPPRLWPLVLEHATHAFDMHPCIAKLCTEVPTEDVQPEKPDAVYHFLDDGRESFVRLLIQRQSWLSTRAT